MTKWRAIMIEASLYLALAGLGFWLYALGALWLYVPLALAVVVAVCVVIWKRETKKDRLRLEQMRRAGLLLNERRVLNQIDYAALREISRVIARDDRAVMAEVDECVGDHVAYFNRRATEFAEEGMDNIGAINKEEFCWFRMIALLVKHRYAAEFDWKTELEDVRWHVHRVAKKLRLTVEPEKFELDFSYEKHPEYHWRDEDDTRTDIYLQEMASALERHGCVLGYIDADADGYVVFLTEPRQKEPLAALAEKYGRSVRFTLDRR